jgi:hypothetical protein
MKIVSSIFSTSIILFNVGITPSPFVRGFFYQTLHVPSLQRQRQRQRQHRQRTPKLFAADKKNEYDIEAASVKLLWERMQESSSQPVLNLSSRNASTEESKTDMSDGRESWSQGQRWKRTREGLNLLDIEVDYSFLQRCPQLLRLDPLMVLETAEWIVNEFGIDYLKSEPRLLSFCVKYVEYGLEFMSIMMMTDAKPACRASTDFFLTAIEGGIHEQAVMVALGAAGDATSKASQTIAGDTMTSIQSLRKRKGSS